MAPRADIDLQEVLVLSRSVRRLGVSVRPVHDAVPNVAGRTSDSVALERLVERRVDRILGSINPSVGQTHDELLLLCDHGRVAVHAQPAHVASRRVVGATRFRELFLKLRVIQPRASMRAHRPLLVDLFMACAAGLGAQIGEPLWDYRCDDWLLIRGAGFVKRHRTVDDGVTGRLFGRLFDRLCGLRSAAPDEEGREERGMGQAQVGPRAPHPLEVARTGCAGWHTVSVQVRCTSWKRGAS